MRPILLPLGTGAGATCVYDGEASSAFAILVGGEARLLVDIGYGVVRQAIQLLRRLPVNIYISHNHSDHSGDLPVAAIKSATAGAPLTVWSVPEVMERLKTHRLHEFLEAGMTADKLCRWVPTPAGKETTLDADLSLTPHPSRHSEACYGFVLRFQGAPVLGYSADSGFCAPLYEQLAVAPLLVLDARLQGSQSHASFAEIRSFCAEVPGKRFFVTHYGRADEAPSDLPVLRPGVPVEL